ncbi:MAG: valine--tRNA ligase [Desulfurellaceae bacterium]|nr:valine--tRNA ligase [Desulfurellaceae bacterium]
MPQALAPQYDPSGLEQHISRQWAEAKAFAAIPDDNPHRYVIMMPLPNVTGALHMGHAMDNVMQDMLTRWHRMLADNTLWMAGTDHAGIATQAVVEKRLLELEGKTRHDIGRDALVERIWDWKEQYQARIVSQQQAMGCSCDWDRQRFTMDPVCARAVSWTFFRLFEDGLIFRGTRLVNWDCHLQTAVADDEIVYETVQGHFWHLRYPIIDPQPGEPDHVVVATTRPETMLGDTAVACHPDPRGALEDLIAKTQARLAAAGQKERAEIEAELARLTQRRQTHLPLLERLTAMARAGRMVRLPLLDRPIPLLCDEWAKPELGSGCVKITPAHDPNDYEVWTRHSEAIGLINILDTDGSLNANAGPYQGLDRFAARDRIVADLESQGLLEQVEDRETEVGHSDRSKTPIEPYLSEQWFVRMGDVAGGVVCGRGTDKEFTTPGLAQAAIDAAQETWRSPSGRQVSFHPDVRYCNTYLTWLAEKRDWCISRQLWWGHRIPIWAIRLSGRAVADKLAWLEPHLDRPDLVARLLYADGSSQLLRPGSDRRPAEDEDAQDAQDAEVQLLVCLREPAAQEPLARELEAVGFERDPDVLDTWFSSGLWPHSTLGWPDPDTAAVEPGQTPLGQHGGADCLSFYYPGSCLVTGRDIITLWVARMVILGLYNLGDVPFTDVFIHATILDGKGERMSKSKGNGIDPVDIIERYGCDAMRYVLCEMQTGSQDIRLPVQALSPYTNTLVDLATAKHGRTIFTYVCPETGKEFDVLGTMPDIPAAKLVSERFEVGRNFCNKLWNATRFALLNLEGASFRPLRISGLALEDRWILSRLSRATAEVRAQLEAYNPAAAIAAVREFFWSELCDWYVEMIKPRLREAGQADPARQVLAFAIDQVLRLLHPFIPFLTEFLWQRLNEQTPQRGIDQALPSPQLLTTAAWPRAQADWQDTQLEHELDFLRETIRAIRDIRSQYTVAPRHTLVVRIKVEAADAAAARMLQTGTAHLRSLAGVESLQIGPDVERTTDAATAVVGEVEVYVLGVVDVEKERVRLAGQIKKLTGSLEGTRKKLANEKFVSRAKPEVVAKERGRLADMESQLATLHANLSALG